MSSPLLFFIIIIGIDLILKTQKDKRKIKGSRKKRPVHRKSEDLGKGFESNGQRSMEKPESIRDLISMLKEEVEKEKLRQLERQTKANKTIKLNMGEKKSKEIQKDARYKRKELGKEDKDPIEPKIEVKLEEKKNDLKEDIIRGIIFSEILSEPKAIKNQKKNI